MVKEEKQLIGIKAIARYLDMSVRNIYYWEKKLGLPIHRVSGHTGYRIYAYKEEIDRWLQDKDAKTLKGAKHKKKILPAIISICILIPILLIFLLSQFPGDESNGLASFSVDGKIIHVKNSKGDILWSINHGYIFNERELKNILDTSNIDNDPQKELVACIYDLLHKDKYSITLFDHDGRIIWKRMMTPKYTFSEIEIKDYFRPMPVRFARSKTKEILIISKWIHMERFLSIIACHNLEGDLVSQYHHTGQLESSLELIDLDGDGCVEIVFGGTNNLLNGEAIIGVLPLEGFYGINPPYQVEPEYNDQTFNLENYIADEIIQGNQLVYL
ncbi:MAG: MerR family transcriptional regulator, partial [Candidatus Aminicenantes bacterium]